MLPYKPSPYLREAAFDPANQARLVRSLGRQLLRSEIAEMTVLSMAGSTLDSGMRPRRISPVAAWMIARIMDRCRETGRSARKTPACWPHSISGANFSITGTCRR